LTRLFSIVNKMASRTVGTESDGVERAAQFRLVFRMSDQAAQFIESVRELALVAVFARAVLFEWPAKFRLVARRIGRRCQTASQ